MKLRNHKDLAVTDTEYGAVLLDAKSGQYWQLNPTAALVVRVLLDGGDEPEAVRRVTEHFEVDVERASVDVHALIESMREAGVVQK
ncbi:lasso peptide biosynthesis PqqD family chaperone [Streptomyces sp. TP-A0874]|uniref:lasso peptide biosynthesis PqqD family chaperone n=1 Tax=Streptomyces sp. TP-A0874 TaxID=549819 RepID=UPI000852BD9E|nr:lasso peptide biosynthesis PqqD family chaperone [Streptomyces sp. TP-A0874]